MNFSDTTNKNGIVQEVEQLVGNGDAYFSGDATRLKQITSWINQATYQVALWIWESDNGWQWDDKNHTDFAIATATLVANQRDYSLPTDLLKIRSVEVMDSGGNYSEVKYLAEGAKGIKEERWQEENGLPYIYYLEDNSIILYPKPASSDVTLASGLRIWFNREIDEFSSSDTTQEPGFAEPYHRIVPLMVAEKFASIKGMPEVKRYCYEEVYGDGAKKEGLMTSLQRFYSNRNDDYKSKIRTKDYRKMAI